MNQKAILLFKELEEKDYEKFLHLLREEFGAEREEQIKSRFLRCLGSEITLFIAIQDHILGYLMIHWIHGLWADTPEGLISSLYVSSYVRELGIGAKLIEKAILKAKEINCSRLWLENNRNNPIYAKEFYKKRGWKERADLVLFEFQS